MDGQVPLVEFLTARLDEDEAMAKAAERKHWRYQVDRRGEVTEHSLELDDDVVVEIGYMDDDLLRPGEAAHAARHDPTQVLREIEAKRSLVAYYLEADAEAVPFEVESGVAAGLYKALQFAALPYADRPDYDKAWAL